MSNASKTPETRIRLRDALLRQDLSSFIQKVFATCNPGTEYLHNWHIDYLAEHLRACERGEIRRLIINLPPRALKSLCISVAWPAWLLGQDPSRRIIVASYAEKLALKHSLDCRLVMQSRWYRELFPETRFAEAQNEKHKFVTTARGYRIATSIGGTVTGEGGNFLIVDDPHNPTHIFSEAHREAALHWFDQTFSSRLDDKKRGVFVIVMQRLHEKDLTGHVLGKGAGEWVQVSLPAVAERREVCRYAVRLPGDLLQPAREGHKELEQAKRELGSYAFAAQYQQSPVPVEGGMVKREWMKRYHYPLPCTGEGKRIIQSWDTAIKTGAGNDYSVCTTWAETDAGYYLLDCWRERAEYPDLKRRVVSLAECHKADAVLMEDKASGQSLLQDLKRETKLPLIAVMPFKDKITRMASVSALFEAGKIHLPEYAAWLPDFEAELFSFPGGAHDDQCDSVSQFLMWARGKHAEKWRIRRL